MRSNELSTNAALYALRKSVSTTRTPASQRGFFSACPCCYVPQRTFVPLQFLTNDSENDDRLLTEIVAILNSQSCSIVDTHTHAHMLPPDVSDCDNIGNTPITRHLTISLAVSPDDFDDLQSFKSQRNRSINARVIAGYGIHPWFAKSHRIDDFFDVIKERIVADDGAMVGEIGLDKSARWLREGDKDVNWQLQFKTFTAQFELAGELRRGVSVHLVNKVHSAFYNYLVEQKEMGGAWPNVIALHSYSGTSEFANKILRFEKTLGDDGPRFYFGFSNYVNFRSTNSAKTNDKIKDILRLVPLSRILVESDIKGESGDNVLETARTIKSVYEFSSSESSKLEDVVTTLCSNGEAFARLCVRK